MVRTWAANVVGCPNVGQSVDGSDVGWFVGGELWAVSTLGDWLIARRGLICVGAAEVVGCVDAV